MSWVAFPSWTCVQFNIRLVAVHSFIVCGNHMPVDHVGEHRESPQAQNQRSPRNPRSPKNSKNIKEWTSLFKGLHIPNFCPCSCHTHSGQWHLFSDMTDSKHLPYVPNITEHVSTSLWTSRDCQVVASSWSCPNKMPTMSGLPFVSFLIMNN